MLRLRRFLLLAAVAALATALGGGAARAAVTYDAVLATTHFTVHYTGDPTYSGKITQQQAGEVGANLEKAYAAYASWGYNLPVDDGDGHVDVYVDDVAAENGGTTMASVTRILGSGSQAPVTIELDAKTGLALHQVAAATWYAFVAANWLYDSAWFDFATSEWAAFRVEGYPTTSLGVPDRSLDCFGNQCGTSDYERWSWPSWSFFEYLTERYGADIVKEIFARARTDADPARSSLDIIGEALGAHGQTVSDAFNDWSIARLTGNFTAPGIKGQLPVAYNVDAKTGKPAPIETGVVSGPVGTTKVVVNHLAARYLVYARGSSSATGPCFEATLKLDVTLPSGTNSRPFFVFTGTSEAKPVPLVISGSTATGTFPWDTCTWPSDQLGYLSLPNASLTADSQEFAVTATLTVDPTKPTTALPPPAAASVWGPIVPAPTVDEPPTIDVFGPELLRVSAKKPVVRLIVASSGPGTLKAELGSAALGTAKLRAGNNDVRFTLPKSLLESLRRQASTAKLSLTSVGANGETGQTVTRRVVIEKAKKHR